jgi:TRAP-type mannitol/chloroaromatic compound transport system permease small subunit
MLGMYYKIWVDAIAAEKAKKGEEGSWKAFTIIPMSILQGINLLTFLFLLRIITHGAVPIVLSLNIFRERALNTFVAGALTFFIPFVIINYLLVFYNERYKLLMKEYSNNEGKLYRNYFLISVGIIIIPLLLKLIF